MNFFNTLTLKQIFWKTQTLLKKIGVPFSSWSTKIENVTFSDRTDRTALSKPNEGTAMKIEKPLINDCFRVPKVSWKFYILNIYLNILFRAHNLTLLAPIPQNGQTHSNNSSAIWRRIVCVFDHFVKLALNGLMMNKITKSLMDILNKIKRCKIWFLLLVLVILLLLISLTILKK